MEVEAEVEKRGEGRCGGVGGDIGDAEDLSVL